MKRKVITSVLIIVMLMSFLGCGSSEPAETTAPTTQAPSTTAAPGTTAPESDAATTEAATEPTPFDAEGYEFYFAGAGTFDPAAVPGTSLAAELKVIYARIEKDLNCRVEFVPGAKIEDVMASVSSGQKIGDFIKGRQETWIPLSVDGYIRALDGQEFIDAGLDLNNEDVFFQQFTHLSDFNGHTWAVDFSGKFGRMDFGAAYGFNKRLCEEAGYPADKLYKAVYDMEWTYEMFLEVARKIQNNDDPENIIWGVALDDDGDEIWSNGDDPIINVDGKWVDNTSSPQIMEALEFMAKINDRGALSPPLYSVEGIATVGRGDRRRLFYTGKAGFAGLYGPNFGEDSPSTKDMSDPVGMLPIPKGPQADGYVMTFVDCDLYYMPTSVTEIEKAARIMNAIASSVHDIDEYYDFLYYESMLEDEDAYKILTEYLMPTGRMNLCKFSKPLYKLIRNELVQTVYDGSKSPKQSTEEYGPMVQAELDAIFKQ